MRRTLIALACVALAGCGSGDEPTGTVKVEKDAQGHNVAYAESQYEADQLCARLQANWTVDGNVVQIFRDGTRDNLGSCEKP